MAKIFFSLSGEGRGHASRVRAIVEHLRSEHDIVIYAPGEAYNFLSPAYHGSDIRVEEMAGLRFHYTASRRLAFGRTSREAIGYLRRLPSLVSSLTEAIRAHRPDLVISDFEPALPRAARKAGVPCVSIDHQNFLTTYDLSSLPLPLRLHAFYMGLIVRGYGQSPVHRVVSSFYFPPLRRGLQNVTQVGVLLRQEVVEAIPRNNGHLVVYLRRFAGENVLQALEGCGREVRVYGLGQMPPHRNLQFLPIDEAGFVNDLSSCDALICTAGNQLVGEALHLGKPVFALPEARNYEQYINGHFLRQSAAGESAELEQLDGARLANFLNRLGEFRSKIDRQRINGLPRTLHVIRRLIDNPRWLTHPETQPEFNPVV